MNTSSTYVSEAPSSREGQSSAVKTPERGSGEQGQSTDGGSGERGQSTPVKATAGSYQAGCTHCFQRPTTMKIESTLPQTEASNGGSTVEQSTAMISPKSSSDKLTAETPAGSHQGCTSCFQLPLRMKTESTLSQTNASHDKSSAMKASKGGSGEKGKAPAGSCQAGCTGCISSIQRPARMKAQSARAEPNASKDTNTASTYVPEDLNGGPTGEQSTDMKATGKSAENPLRMLKQSPHAHIPVSNDTNTASTYVPEDLKGGPTGEQSTPMDPTEKSAKSPPGMQKQSTHPHTPMSGHVSHLIDIPSTSTEGQFWYIRNNITINMPKHEGTTSRAAHTSRAGECFSSRNLELLGLALELGPFFNSVHTIFDSQIHIAWKITFGCVVGLAVLFALAHMVVLCALGHMVRGLRAFWRRS